VQKEREFYSAEPFTALNLERARKRMFAEMTFTSTARPK
jgi:hypothetical protein